MDGMECVEDCGQRFIHNRSCASTCPVSQPYIIEDSDLRRTGFLILKVCLEKCPENTFLYKGICEHACPLNAHYSLNGTCTVQCPDTHRFERNMTKNGRFVSKECLVNCSGQFPVKRGPNVCIAKCSPPLVQFENACLDVCPTKANLTMDSLSTKGTTRYCVESCPRQWYLYNNSCVRDCPEEHFIYNDTLCVNSCPADAPFETDYVDGKSHRCVPDCDEFYSYNKTCLHLCPLYTLNNKSCVETCPDSAPFVCDENHDRRCTLNNHPPWWSRSLLLLCQEKCPFGMYNFNNTCLHDCPSEMKVYNDSCVLNCPEHSHFVEANNCVKECSNDTYTDGFNCVNTCPDSKYSLNMTCVENCPLSAPFRYEYEEYRYIPWNQRPVLHRLCLDMCPDDMYGFNNTCVYSCPTEFKNYKNSCVEHCPSESPYTDRITPSQCHYSRATGRYCSPPACVNECPENSNTDSNSCVEYCPRNKYTLEKNRTCLYKCPSTDPLLHDTGHFGTYCRNQCPERTFYNEGKCVSGCAEKHIFNNSCVTQCPPSLPVEMDGYCVSECPQERFKNQNHCLSSCPSNLMIFTTLCVEQCPSSHPLIETSSGVKTCVEKCDSMSWNGHCIYEYDCKAKIIMGDKCLDQCPDRYMWISNNATHRYSASDFPVCHKKAAISILFVLALILFFNSAMMYWRCFSPTFETCISRVFCRGYHKLVSNSTAFSISVRNV